MRHIIALLAISLALAACGSGAPASSPTPAPSAPPSAGATPSRQPSPSTSAAPAASSTPAQTAAPTPAAPFAITSPAFTDGGEIPAMYTCDGADVSPEVRWSGVPAGTASLVLLVLDPDAASFAHWIALNLSPTSSGLDKGAGVPGAQFGQGTNDFGRVGWGGPCPPSGTHRYVFTLYALATQLGLSGHQDAVTVRAVMASATVLGTASLEGRYKRP